MHVSELNLVDLFEAELARGPSGSKSVLLRVLPSGRLACGLLAPMGWSVKSRGDPQSQTALSGSSVMPEIVPGNILYFSNACY